MITVKFFALSGAVLQVTAHIPPMWTADVARNRDLRPNHHRHGLREGSDAARYLTECGSHREIYLHPRLIRVASLGSLSCISGAPSGLRPVGSLKEAVGTGGLLISIRINPQRRCSASTSTVER
ncbi:hypothetical protein BJ322DRAFT_1061100 [Thelephora terrestris]|uniref:Secreted protein n=1 Tax=Thelephora terrestris TaxID=56493 RepID=A0A9P6HDX3_9AGAM|nr:hypothetical protein BJ322DRAFT_1061100 [Thelephora terrestris]